ncbi:glycerophosphodiester phosphodiesterase family protein [Streptomyces sp. x-80]|uniref:glycerophosphodiester phosphodiesterase family protein n=1 Tax=Streptomyces sp. x-80 TaxID=2789282 RepID=UPI00397EA1FB
MHGRRTIAAAGAITLVLTGSQVFALTTAALGKTPAAARVSGNMSDKNAMPPLVIAHRGGTSDRPENTITAIKSALAQKVDMMWLSVQVSSDGIPVLYRPADLSALTDGKGAVANHTAAELSRLNAGWSFSIGTRKGDATYPYRKSPTPIPTLADALDAIPPSMPVLLDLKFSPLPDAAAAVAKTIGKAGAWSHVRFYSTERDNLTALARYPQAQLFEDRDTTRTRLAISRLTGACQSPPAAKSWSGFELRRDVELTEEYTLGRGISPVPKAVMWDQRASDCFHTHPGVKTVFFGINNRDGYETAMNLGAYAILADSPRGMMAIKNSLSSARPSPSTASHGSVHSDSPATAAPDSRVPGPHAGAATQDSAAPKPIGQTSPPVPLSSAEPTGPPSPRSALANTGTAGALLLSSAVAAALAALGFAVVRHARRHRIR